MREFKPKPRTIVIDRADSLNIKQEDNNTITQDIKSNYH